MAHQSESSAKENFFSFCRTKTFISATSESALKDIINVIAVKKYKELQPIGHTCRTIYYINRGIARIFYYKDEKDITESFSLENDIVVRVESLFKGIPSKKGIQVLEDAEIIAIDAQKLFHYRLRPNVQNDFEYINRIIGTSFTDQARRTTLKPSILPALQMQSPASCPDFLL